VHPDETKDEFSDDSFLIKQAQKVPALKNNQKFQDALKKGTYDKWALTMSNQFTADGINSTPTVKLNGTAVDSVQAMTPAQFKSAIEAKLVH
jgi:protein-disulfide isomerase